ncbi:hypothetical protein EPH_0042810 [Eimeria praecox]|uniref:Uncharacterized protein n=1 Tax=Eimeria praecox TaxID=51316 RepID=U6G8L9_9EIME|nr:hypothetical protein EPH_0042810 [Eimeria praecox]
MESKVMGDRRRPSGRHTRLLKMGRLQGRVLSPFRTVGALSRRQECWLRFDAGMKAETAAATECTDTVTSPAAEEESPHDAPGAPVYTLLTKETT